MVRISPLVPLSATKIVFEDKKERESIMETDAKLTFFIKY
jgi:hypothetical protein